MLNLTRLQSLVAAVDTGSLTAAARRLGMTQPAVSQHLAALEAEIGAPLLRRSRRGVTPTPTGALVHRHGQDILSRLARLDDALAESRGEVSGRLRVTTNILFSQTLALPFVARLRTLAPKLKVEIVATDTVLDLAEADLDMALRAGSAGKGGGVARRIADLDGVLVALPAYLDAKGRPEMPEQLDRLDFVQYREDMTQTHMMLEGPRGRVEAPVRLGFAAHAPSLLLHAVESGLGFAHAPRFYVAPMLAAGKHEQVLPDWQSQAKPLYLVQPADAVASPRHRLARAVLFDVLAEQTGIHLAPSAAREAQGEETSRSPLDHPAPAP